MLTNISISGVLYKIAMAQRSTAAEMQHRAHCRRLKWYSVLRNGHTHTHTHTHTTTHTQDQSANWLSFACTSYIISISRCSVIHKLGLEFELFAANCYGLGRYGVELAPNLIDWYR